MSATDDGHQDSKENQPDAIASSQAALPLDGELMFCDEEPPTTGEEPMHTDSKPPPPWQYAVETKPGTPASEPDAKRRRSRRSVLGQGRLSVGNLIGPEPDKVELPKEKKQKVHETKLGVEIKNTMDYIKRLKGESTAWDDLIKDVEKQVEKAQGLSVQLEAEASNQPDGDLSQLTAIQRRALQGRPNYPEIMNTLQDKLIQETISLKQILNQCIKHREVLKAVELKCEEQSQSCYEAAFPECAHLDPKDVLYDIIEMAHKSGTAQDPVLIDMKWSNSISPP